MIQYRAFLPFKPFRTSIFSPFKQKKLKKEVFDTT